MSEKYTVGTFVVYDIYGICKIDRIEKLSFSKDTPKKDYYVLSPLNSQSSTYYLPVSNSGACQKLRLPMTEAQIQELLIEAKKADIQWIERRQERADLSNRILAGGISPELVRLVGCLYEKHKAISEQGKKLSSTDEHFFLSAENMLKEEFSFSLGIPAEEVSQYIHKFMTAETD